MEINLVFLLWLLSMLMRKRVLLKLFFYDFSFSFERLKIGHFLDELFFEFSSGLKPFKTNFLFLQK